MSIIDSHVIPYQRTLTRPIVTSHGVYRFRQGFILAIVDEEGRIGIGDAAPLPGLSSDTVQECEQALTELTKVPKHRDLSGDELSRELPTTLQECFFDKNYIPEHAGSMWHLQEYQSVVLGLRPSSPAMLFAVATALGDLKAKCRDTPLAQAMHRGSATQVSVNGLITEKETEAIASQAKSLDAQGFSSFKIKVGLDHAGDDVTRICAVCSAAPNARLRLDANGGWDKKWAESVLSNVPRSHIEFIEQPYPHGQWEASRQLSAKYHVRLALDEDVQTIDEAKGHIRNRACDVLVLKPMVLGRLYQCVLLSEEAREAGIEVIYTSSWESDIGIAATLHLAAALGPNPPAMGLSTAGMIAEGIVTNPLKIEHGYLKVPKGPGLGMTLTPELLERLK